MLRVRPDRGAAQLFNRPDYLGEPLSGRLGDAIFYGLLFGVFLPGLLLLVPRIVGPMAGLLPAESIQVERMIRDCRPGEDAKLRAAAVAVCRHRMRGNGPITMAVLVVGLAGMAVWAVLSRDFGDAVLMVGLLALMPWLIRSARQSQARFRAFLAATTPE